MANPHKGELAITAGGRPYVLQYTSDSLVELEDALDMGIMAILAELQTWSTDPRKMRLKWVRALFWAGLRAHHPEVDLKAAGELITEVEGKALQVVNLTGEAMGLAFGGGEETSTTGPQGPVNGTGTGSSPTSLASAITPASSGTSPPGSSG